MSSLNLFSRLNHCYETWFARSVDTSEVNTSHPVTQAILIWALHVCGCAITGPPEPPKWVKLSVQSPTSLRVDFEDPEETNGAVVTRYRSMCLFLWRSFSFVEVAMLTAACRWWYSQKGNRHNCAFFQAQKTCCKTFTTLGSLCLLQHEIAGIVESCLWYLLLVLVPQWIPNSVLSRYSFFSSRALLLVLLAVVYSPFPDFTDSKDFVKTDLTDMKHIIEDLEEVSLSSFVFCLPALHALLATTFVGNVLQEFFEVPLLQCISQMEMVHAGVAWWWSQK